MNQETRQNKRLADSIDTFHPVDLVLFSILVVRNVSPPMCCVGRIVGDFSLHSDVEVETTANPPPHLVAFLRNR